MNKSTPKMPNGSSSVVAEDLKAWLKLAGAALPANTGGKNLLKRFLDRAVIQHVHTSRAGAKRPAFDTVRGAFVEGAPIYPTAGFFEKSHIQICVRQPRCIKGYFRILPEPTELGGPA